MSGGMTRKEFALLLNHLADLAGILAENKHFKTLVEARDRVIKRYMEELTAANQRAEQAEAKVLHLARESDGNYEIYEQAKRALATSQAQGRRLRECLEKIRKKQPETLDMFRRNKIVFKGEGGEWEKVAFSVYTTLCEVEWEARCILEVLDDEAGETTGTEGA